LTAAAGGGGPVLPICGFLFLLAALGPFGHAWNAAQQREVMEGVPGQFGSEIVEEFRKQQWGGLIGILWLVIGTALVATPFYLEPRLWHLGWRINGSGWAIAAGGLCLSCLGALVIFGNAMAMEGASKDVNTVANLAVLAGAVVAALGSFIAVRGA
jgi:hypothetical protein